MADRTIILDGFSKTFAITGGAWLRPFPKSLWNR